VNKTSVGHFAVFGLISERAEAIFHLVSI